jgi:UDP-N-acetylmuramoyl-tripeptide--D-alanyl-D-alanine ligase
MKNFFKKIVVHILTAEAKILIRRHRPIIIAVTGSVGKTSMKDAIYSILKKHHTVRKSEKSFNSEIGIPLTILGIPNAWSNPFLWFKNLVDGFFVALLSKDYPSYLILETGIDRPGDMESLVKWLKPNIVVLTRFPDIPVHVEYFKMPKDVIEEKMRLVDALKTDGVVIYNHDDPTIQSQLSSIRHKAIGYSRYLPSHFMASKDEVSYRDDFPVGMNFDITHLKEVSKVNIEGVIGMQNVYTFTGAIATASQCNISLSDATTALKEHISPPGRMRVIKGIKGTFIIDDTYNSSPIAVEQALMTLKEVKHAKRKIAILGDMLELGRFSAREHERMGELVPTCTDVLFTVGVRSHKTASSALAHGLNESNIFQYEDVARAGRELQNFIQPGDVILIKASQGIRAEKIVLEIMDEPEKAKDLLVRQEKAWESK